MNLYNIQLIDIEDMDVVEIIRTAPNMERLIKEVIAIANDYNNDGYFIDKIKIFNRDYEFITSFNL